MEFLLATQADTTQIQMQNSVDDFAPTLEQIEANKENTFANSTWYS